MYSLKSRFQTLLLPIQNILITLSITPNQVTIFSCVLCLMYSALLAWSEWTQLLLLILPLLLFIRMTLNALDGMVAKTTNNTTSVGMVLNEVCDVISDLALFSAFFLVLQIPPVLWWGLIVLSLLTEFVSLAVYQARKIRSHSGPFGKSDRAVFLGVLAVILVVIPTYSEWILAYTLSGVLLASITIFNRFATLFDTSEHV